MIILSILGDISSIISFVHLMLESLQRIKVDRLSQQ